MVHDLYLSIVFFNYNDLIIIFSARFGRPGPARPVPKFSAQAAQPGARKKWGIAISSPIGYDYYNTESSFYTKPLLQ